MSIAVTYKTKVHKIKVKVGRKVRPDWQRFLV